MNQNPFAFFTPDANGYPQLPDPLGQTTYLDTRNGGLVIRDDTSLHNTASTLSHTSSHDTESTNQSLAATTTPRGNGKKSVRTPKSKAEVSERMRRWRTENAEKNRLNDLRCRVYRQARIRFGKDPTPEREAWIQSEIFRRLERRRLREVMKGGGGSTGGQTGSGSIPAPNPANLLAPPSGAITRSRSTVHPFPVHSGSSSVPDHPMGFTASPYTMMANAYDPSSHSQHQYPQPQPQFSGSYLMHPQFNGTTNPAAYAQQMAVASADHSNQQQGNFMAAAVQPNGEMYNGFKLINPLYSAARTQPTSQSPMYSSTNTGHSLVSDHHSVPSNQHSGELSFQLPAPNGTQYYQDNSTWDPNMSAAAVAAAAVVSQHNPQPLLPPPSSSSQYALHSIDQSRSIASATTTAQSTAGMASLSMVSPIAAAASVVSQTDQPQQQQAAPVDTSYLYQTTNTSNQDTVSSPSLNDVATNLFTLKQTTSDN